MAPATYGAHQEHDCLHVLATPSLDFEFIEEFILRDGVSRAHPETNLAVREIISAAWRPLRTVHTKNTTAYMSWRPRERRRAVHMRRSRGSVRWVWKTRAHTTVAQTGRQVGLRMVGLDFKRE